jgi:hypothetical protein
LDFQGYLAYFSQALIFGYALTEGRKCPWGAFHQGKVTELWRNSVIFHNIFKKKADRSQL